MPLSVVPTSVNEPNEPDGCLAEPAHSVPEPPNGRQGAAVPPQNSSQNTDSDPVSAPGEPEIDANNRKSPVVRGSRWIDYDTHELLTMISELEDERRWARLREGIWIAILVHLVLLSSLTWIPKYIFKVPPVIDPFEAIKQRKDDLRYLDSAARRAQEHAAQGGRQAGSAEAAADRQEDP